jgi:hypothetical protein
VPVGRVGEVFRPAWGGLVGSPAAHSDLRVLERCVFARPQVTTVALAQWEEPGVCTKDRGRAS